MKVYINVLFFLGVFLLFVGIVTAQVMENGSIIPMATIIIAIAFIIISLISFLYTSKGFWSMRSTEAMTNALVSTVAVVLIILLVNFLGIKYAIRIDLTENKLFTLSPQSQELVNNLNSPLKVYVFSHPINKIDQQLLENYQSYSKLFDYQFVNPQVDISLAQKFNVTRTGDVYVEYEDKQQLAQIVSPENRLEEVKLTSAIAKLQKDIQAQVYVIQGHGEPVLQEGGEVSYSQAVSSLTNQGYVVEALNLMTSPLVPPSADVVVVSSAQRKFLPEELDKIQKYLDRGGNLLVMYNAQSTNTLENILNQWGVSLDQSVVLDPSGAGDIFGLGPSVNIVVNYGKHPITQNFNNGPTLFPWARPIKTASTENIEVTPLIITNDLSWGEANISQENIQFNPEEDVQGPLNLGVALLKRNIITQETGAKNQEVENLNQPLESTSETQPSDNLISGESDLPNPPLIKTPNPQRSTITSGNQSLSPQKMVVIGNNNFATNGWFQQQLNSDFFLNSIAWLANESEENISIRPKESTNRRLNISKSQVTLISWLALLIIPGLGLIVAVITWWRRNK